VYGRVIWSSTDTQAKPAKVCGVGVRELCRKLK